MANKVSVAVLGASGIGRIHVREFLNTGADVVGVLCSTPESTRRCAESLSQEFDAPLHAFADMDEVMDAGLRAISICTPPETHLDFLERALGAGLYVFCEKPLFWQDGIDQRTARQTLSEIKDIAAGRLAVNTSNAWFIESWRRLTKQTGLPETFDFSYFTQGPSRGANIGLDLLPHALSLLLELGAEGEIENLDVAAGKHRFDCRFDFGTTHCRFDLREEPDMEKALSFTLDGHRIERVQKNKDGEYSVYLAADDFADGEARVTDPFRVYITRFMETVAGGGDFNKQAPAIFRNVELMAQILENGKGGKA